jgi:hypothetical protein
MRPRHLGEYLRAIEVDTAGLHHCRDVRRMPVFALRAYHPAEGAISFRLLAGQGVQGQVQIDAPEAHSADGAHMHRLTHMSSFILQ